MIKWISASNACFFFVIFHRVMLQHVETWEETLFPVGRDAPRRAGVLTLESASAIPPLAVVEILHTHGVLSPHMIPDTRYPHSPKSALYLHRNLTIFHLWCHKYASS